MSCGDKHETPCNEVLSSVALLIDGEIHEVSQIHSFEIHFEECSPASNASSDAYSFLSRKRTARIT
jgi:hypothetical protein